MALIMPHHLTPTETFLATPTPPHRAIASKPSARLSPIATGGTIRTYALIALFAAALPASAQSVDPRLGSWTLTSALSTVTPPNQLSVTPVKGGSHIVMTGETHRDFTALANGHPSPAPGNLGFDQIQLHRIDKHQAEVKESKAGAVAGIVRLKISNDGNELLITTLVPNRPDQLAVWTRTGGTKSANDPFAGDWTEDLGKSRLRQGLALKFEDDGRGGVRFSGDFSYDARLDGKPYDLKNSRNDTVALALVDPHTVDATYRRDNQVTQKDRWTVSADGQQLTLSSTATLETGQHITEKLTFKKQ